MWAGAILYNKVNTIGPELHDYNAQIFILSSVSAINHK